MTLAEGAAIVLIWSGFFATLMSHGLSSDYESVVLEALVPAYFLSRLGRRWSRMELASAGSFLVFMSWGAGFEFWPFSGGLEFFGRETTLGRLRAGVGLYGLFYATIIVLGYRSMASEGHADGSTGSSRFSHLQAIVIAATFTTFVVGWAVIAGLNPPPDVNVYLTKAPVVLLLGASVALFASSICDKAPRRVMTVVLLAILWWGAIKVRLVPPPMTLPNQRIPMLIAPPVPGSTARVTRGSPAGLAAP